MNLTPQQDAATGQLVDLIAAKIGNNRAIQPETAIATCARLAGSLMLRSFNFQLSNLKEGSVILSAEANEKTQLLAQVLGGFLSKVGLTLDQSKLGGAEQQRGQPPNLNTIASLSLIQSDALKICTLNGLSMEQAAYSAAVATAFIVKECAPQIGVETGFNVAAFGFVEGCKTVPPLLQSQQASKPWYKLW